MVSMPYPFYSHREGYGGSMLRTGLYRDWDWGSDSKEFRSQNFRLSLRVSTSPTSSRVSRLFLVMVRGEGG